MGMTYTDDTFWTCCEIGPDGCLEWLGRKDKNGYGKLRHQKTSWLAHRLAWHLANGPIPKGIFVCHKCDNPSCIAPSHLFLGTQADNMLDMKNKGRRKGINSGERNGRAKISRQTADRIRHSYFLGGVTQKQLSEDHGVSQSTVSLILRNEIWV